MPPPILEGLPGEDEDTPAVASAVVAPLLVEAEDDELDWRVTRGSERRRIAVGLGLGVALGGMLLPGIRYMEDASTQGIVDEVHRAVLVADTHRLEGLSASLREQIEKQTAQEGVLSAELALVESVLYREHTGRPEQLERARAAAAVARAERRTSAAELALAEGALRWAEGDGPGATAALAEAPATSLIRRRIETELALERGDAALASAAWQPLDEPGAVPWLASLEPGVVASWTEGSDAAVKSAGRLAGLGDVALVPVLSEGWAGTAVEAHVNAIDALLGRATGLPVQQRGTTRATRALLMFSQETGRCSRCRKGAGSAGLCGRMVRGGRDRHGGRAGAQGRRCLRNPARSLGLPTSTANVVTSRH